MLIIQPKNSTYFNITLHANNPSFKGSIWLAVKAQDLFCCILFFFYFSYLTSTIGLLKSVKILNHLKMKSSVYNEQ